MQNKTGGIVFLNIAISLLLISAAFLLKNAFFTLYAAALSYILLRKYRYVCAAAVVINAYLLFIQSNFMFSISFLIIIAALFSSVLLYKKGRLLQLHAVRRRFNFILKSYTEVKDSNRRLQKEKLILSKKLRRYIELYNFIRAFERTRGIDKFKEELDFFLISISSIRYFNFTYTRYFKEVIQYTHTKAASAAKLYKYRETRKNTVLIIQSSDKINHEDKVFFKMIHSILAVEGEKIYLLEQLAKVSILDTLTKLYTHTHIKGVLTREIKRSTRYGETLSAAMVDIDDFKKVNDTYGHLTGDAVLRKLTKIFLSFLEPSFVRIGRYGGEEFLFIFLNSDEAEASAFMNDVREKIEQTSFGKPHITISVGIASFPNAGTNTDALIAAADTALYSAKKKGKNRVETYEH